MRNIKFLIFILLVLLGIISCATEDDTTYYRVAYDGNGNTGGSVPVGEKEYREGKTVYFMDNTGLMVKTGLCFNGWNTTVDGQGTHWAPNDSIASLESDILLYAEWVEYNNVFTFDEANNTITDFQGESGFFDMPSTINGVSVLLVGHDAFNRSGLFAVNFPDTLQGIEARGFTNNILTELELPENLTYLASYTFDHNNLSSISFPANLPVISEYSFGDNNLESVDLRAATTIERAAFHNNPITKITIGASVYIEPSYSQVGTLYNAMGQYGDSFRTYYYDNGQQAGTYIYDAGSWTKAIDSLVYQHYYGCNLTLSVSLNCLSIQYLDPRLLQA